MQNESVLYTQPSHHNVIPRHFYSFSTFRERMHMSDRLHSLNVPGYIAHMSRRHSGHTNGFQSLVQCKQNKGSSGCKFDVL